MGRGGLELPAAWLCCISLPGPACRCQAVIAAVLKHRQSGLTVPLPSGPCSIGAEGHVHSPCLDLESSFSHVLPVLHKRFVLFIPQTPKPWHRLGTEKSHFCD